MDAKALNLLPSETLVNIFSHLDTYSVNKCRGTCSRFHALVERNANMIYNRTIILNMTLSNAYKGVFYLESSTKGGLNLCFSNGYCDFDGGQYFLTGRSITECVDLLTKGAPRLEVRISGRLGYQQLETAKTVLDRMTSVVIDGNEYVLHKGKVLQKFLIALHGELSIKGSVFWNGKLSDYFYITAGSGRLCIDVDYPRVLKMSGDKLLILVSREDLSVVMIAKITGVTMDEVNACVEGMHSREVKNVACTSPPNRIDARENNFPENSSTTFLPT